MSCRYSSKRIKFFFSVLELFCLFCVSNFFSELKSYPGVVFISNFRITKLLNLHLRIRIPTKTFPNWTTDWVTLPWQCKGFCAGHGTGCRLPDRSFHDCPAPDYGSHWPRAAEAHTGRHLSNLWSLFLVTGICLELVVLLVLTIWILIFFSWMVPKLTV